MKDVAESLPDDTAPAPSPPAAGPIWRQVAGLAWPALAQQGLLLSIQLYDQFLIGPFSETHKAALTNANYIYWFVTAYAVVVNAGATALVGRFVGARDLPLACRATGQALLLALVFGIVGTTAGLLGMPMLLSVLQLPDPAAALAIEYLLPLTGLLPFYMIEAGGIACLVGAGDTRTGLKVLGTVVAVNVPLAYGLSQGVGSFEGLGFVGIAWGTGLSHVLGCGLVLATLIRGRYGLRLGASVLRPNRELLERLLRISVPAAFDSISIGLFQFVFLGMVNRLGETAVAAHGIAIRVEGLGYLSGAAFGTATAALVGRALGAGRPDLAARGGWTALILGAGLMTGMGVILFTFARPLFELFCWHTGQSQVIETGVPVLKLVAFAMPGLAATIVLTQALRGAGDTRIPVLFTWAGFLGIRLPLAYLLTSSQFGWNLGLFGAWLAMFADIYVRGLLFVIRFAGGRWKMVRV